MGIAETANWLRSFYRRFDEDIKLLYRVEPFWQICQKCPDGHCCGQNSYISLKRNGNPFFIEDWWLMLEYVRDKFNAEDRKQLALNIISKRTACIFLFNNRCSVHPSRPWGSRIHPYTISICANTALFPAREIALPSCPSLASAFGLKVNEVFVQKPQVITRAKDGHLVLVKLKKHKPLWLIDADDYLQQYERHIPRVGMVTTEWQELLELAEKAGGNYGGLLRLYVEQVLGLRKNVMLVPP